VQALEHERDELDAQAALVRAKQRLADLQPTPPEPTPEPVSEPPPVPEPPPAGLTPHEVEDVLAALPEISPETLKTISLMLAGLQKEKRG
jgi:hypothetical protein